MTSKEKAFCGSLPPCSRCSSDPTVENSEKSGNPEKSWNSEKSGNSEKSKNSEKSRCSKYSCSLTDSEGF